MEKKPRPKVKKPGPKLGPIDAGGNVSATGNVEHHDSTAPFGLRKDSTPKGMGYFGMLPYRGKGAEKDAFSTELGHDFTVDGNILHAPLLVPSLTRLEIDDLLEGKELTEEVKRKAIKHAQDRMVLGKSPFAGPEDEIQALPKYITTPERGVNSPFGKAIGEGIQTFQEGTDRFKAWLKGMGHTESTESETKKPMTSRSANSEVESQLQQLREEQKRLGE